MQCPFVRCSLMIPKIVFLGIGVLGFVLGILSVVWPKRSIALYQWIMGCINWKVAPIDKSREVRNTRVLGAILSALSVIIFYQLFSCS